MNKLLFYFLSGIILSLLIVSCGAKSTSDLNSDVAVFVSSSEDVVGYGYVNLVAIKGKAQLSQIPTIGEFVNDEMKSIENSLKLSDKIHYALEGPLNKDGLPKFAYIFMTVENEDSTLQMFEKMGFFFEKENDLMVSYDMNMAVGFNENTAVLVSGNFGDDPKDKLLNAFSTFNVKKSDQIKNDNVTEILAQTTDILVAGNLENLYKTSNTSLNNLKAEEKAEIMEMVKDGHASLTIDFNNGDLTAKLDFSRVNDKLKAKSFFKENVASDVMKNIGPGQPIFALAMSLDIEKLEKMMKEFSPNSEKSLYSSFGPMGEMFSTLAEDDISNLLDGNIGMMISSEVSTDTIMGTSGIPSSHLYVGLGRNPQNMKDLVETYARENQIVDLGEGFYKIDKSIMLMKDKSIVLHSNDTSRLQFKTGEIEYTESMKDFGNTPFSLFVDFKKLSDSELYKARSEFDVILSIADYMSLTADNEQIVMKLVMKNKGDNILKQVIDAYQDVLKSTMGNIQM
ncbi:hypothetical protein [Brumimicrobium mesophilum]|uniref:hypothetical protein n=1 Tax=Brumimicrobium mesophilum TaxID=392717 RepID=UPI000D1400F1|nr:hypothetical protein [Brumimicrobium mesophilum]